MFTTVVTVVFAQVIMRHVFHNSLSWADELSRFAFVWLVYLGGTITIREGRNVCFDLLLDAFPHRLWKIMYTLVSLLCAVFLIIITGLGILVCQSNVGEVSPIMGLNMEYVVMAIPVGGLLMLFEQISYYLAHINEPKESVEEVAGQC
jgi:TRAP-type C4-dicarboxylate transport system permease small subunit